MSFSDKRYHRQLIMPEIGELGQRRLEESNVFVVGAGGLGSPLLMYLAAAGVGHITIADFDVVEESNLNRQILHRTASVGLPKVASAVQTLEEMNPCVRVTAHQLMVTEDNASELFAGHDLVLDAVDSFGAKFVINDACVTEGLPFIHAGVSGLKGQLFLYQPGSACLRCIFPDVPNELKKSLNGGILGAMAGCIGAQQALLAIQFLLGITKEAGRLFALDGHDLRQSSIEVPQNAACPACGSRM